MNITQQLDSVVDWQSFALFVQSLAAERQEAERLEREDPERYRYEGAIHWQNVQISAFLKCAIACVEDNAHHLPIPDAPSWRFLAEFLHGGKIYE